MSYEFNGDVLSIETSRGIVHSFDFRGRSRRVGCDSWLGRKTKMQFAVNAKSEAERIEIGSRPASNGVKTANGRRNGKVADLPFRPKSSTCQDQGQAGGSDSEGAASSNKPTRKAILGNEKVVEEAAR